MPGKSGVAIRIPLPPSLAAVREAGEASARMGIPPHVTVLYPFVPAAELTPAVRSALAGIAADHRPFVATMGPPEIRDDMVWLVPRDQGPFLRLTASVHARWPEHPPYGGTHPDLIAHLLVIQTADRLEREAARAAAMRVCPFHAAVTELEVLTEDDEGRWRLRWRLPLGSPAPDGGS